MSKKPALAEYIDASGESVSSFARRAGVAVDVARAILAGQTPATIKIARRIVAASGNAVTIGELYQKSDENDGGNIIDFRQAAMSSPSMASDILNIDVLVSVLRNIISAFSVENKNSIAPEAIMLAAEATINIYDALEGVIDDQDQDRLAQALLSVLQSILSENSVRPLSHAVVAEAASAGAKHYLQLSRRL